MPLQLYVDSRGAKYEDAFWSRAFRYNGLRYGDKIAVISDPRHFAERNKILEKLGFFKRKYISIFDDVEKQISILTKFKPTVIRSYTSSLLLLSQKLVENFREINPRLIFSSAEILHEESRKLIESTFNCDVLDNYACNEFSLMGWECSSHEGYHINMDNVVMEFIKNDEFNGNSKFGEIVCTSLVNYAMPLIRYRLGDVGNPNKKICSCGLSLPTVKEINGRSDDFLVAIDGRIISPTVFFPYPFSNTNGIKQFRVIQEDEQNLLIELVIQKEIFEGVQVLKNAEKQIKNLFGEKMKTEFIIVDKIDKEKNGKIRKVVSKIPIELS